MQKYLALASLLVLALASVEAAPADKLDCSKIDEVLDDLGGAQGITTLNDKYKLATNAEEFTKRCQEMADAVKMLKKYNKECYSSLTQQVFSAIMRTRSQMNEARCAAGSDSFKEAVESTKCIQENALEAVKDAEKKTILASQVIFDANISDEKLRLRRSCCAVLDSKTFFMDAVKTKCSKYEKVYSDYVDSYTSESMSLICPEKLDCKELEPLKLEGVEVKSKFFLTPMLKLVKSLDH